MRVLFLNSEFPGQFRALARAYGAAGHLVLFLAESGQKSAALPHVRRLRLAPPQYYESADAAEQECVRLLRRAARAGNAMLGLRRQGFAPDIVIAAASMGGSFYVRDIFPEAFCVCYGDWFSTPVRHGGGGRGAMRAIVDFAPAHVRNLWEYNALCDCHLAVTSSLWQREQYPPLLQAGIHVVHAGINTRYFSPAPVQEAAAPIGEIVTFCAPPQDPARCFSLFKHCLPRLLSRRPRCLVLLAWPDNGRSMARQGQDDSTARALLDLPEMPAEFGGRVRLLGPCPSGDYRAMLRKSTAHVYLGLV